MMLSALDLSARRRSGEGSRCCVMSTDAQARVNEAKGNLDDCRYASDARTQANPKRTEAYLQDHQKPAEDWMRKAGFRLAHLLNQALAPAYIGQVRNSTHSI